MRKIIAIGIVFVMSSCSNWEDKDSEWCLFVDHHKYVGEYVSINGEKIMITDYDSWSHEYNLSNGTVASCKVVKLNILE